MGYDNSFSYDEKHLTKMPTRFNSFVAIFREFCLKLNECITKKCMLFHYLSITTSD